MLRAASRFGGEMNTHSAWRAAKRCPRPELPRLVKHGRALGRRLGKVVAVDLVVTALMLDPVDLARIGKHTRGLVAFDGVILTSYLPKACTAPPCIIGPLVAFIVLKLRIESHRAGGAVEIAGDDIPTDAAACEVIEGREAPGEKIWRLVAQVDGDAETQVPGHGGHCGDEEQRVVDGQLNRLPQGHVDIVFVDVVDADDIGEKDAVEQTAFKRARLLGPVFDRVVVGRAVPRMRPQAVVDVPDANSC